MLRCNRTTCCFYISPTFFGNQKGRVACFAFKLCTVVNNFLCHFNSRYVGRTSQQLKDRIREHVFKFILTDQIPNSRNISTRFGKSSTSIIFVNFAIVEDLLDNPLCAKNYSDKNLLFFHLAVRFSIYLLQKPFTSNHASQIYVAKKSLFTTWNSCVDHVL